MSMWRRYRDLFGPNPERDLSEELRFHLETETEELMAAGLSREDALKKALAKFGDMERCVAECQASDARRLKRRHRGRLFDVLRQDVRYAVRRLAHRPAFAAAVIIVLALGVGANAAVFSVADHVFLRPPAEVREPAQLKRLLAVRKPPNRAEYFQARFSFPEARLIDSAVGEIGPSTIFYRRDVAFELEPGSSESLGGSWVAPDFFAVLGVPLAVGSDFGVESAQYGVPASSAIISWGLWQRAFAAEPSVLGRTIRVDGRPVIVRGITSRGFTGLDVDVTDIWLPLPGLTGFRDGRARPWYEDWDGIAFRVLARLPDGVSADQLVARTEAGLRASAAAYALDNPQGEPSHAVLRVIPAPLHSALGPEPMSYREALAAVLSGLAVLLLVIAIANVGNLLLGRALDRRREIAVCVALGMSRLRLVSQVAIESLLLGGAAIIASGIAASWTGGVLRSMLLPGVDFATGPMDRRIATLAIVLGIAAAIVAAVVPLWSTLRIDLTKAIKTGNRDGGGRRSRIRSALVGVQAALSVVLLVGTGLLARSLYNIRTLDLGLDVENVISVRAATPAAAARLPDLATLARSLPGVTNVALAALPPLFDLLEVSHLIRSQGDTVPPLESPVWYLPAEPGYLAAVGTRVLQGRDFASEDRFGAAPVMIVSEEMARRVWPGVIPIGECLRIERVDGPCHTVVGVAENAHRFAVVEQTQPVIYVPLDQRPDRAAGGARAGALVVRTAAGTEAVVARLREEFRDSTAMRRGQPVQVLANVLARQYDTWELGARLFTGLAALALVLSLLGLYGVLNYVVTLRTRELGVRLALGADRRHVMALVVREGIYQITAGAIVGVAIALVGGGRISSLLYQVSPQDPAVILAALLVLIVCAALAAMVPARRAMAIDPISAIREE